VSVLLAGIVISMLFTSLGALLSSLTQDDWQLARALMRFSLGSIDTKGLSHVALASPLCFSGIAAAWWWGRQMDVLLAGEDEARSLGLDLSALRRWLIVWSTLLVAAAVAIGGAISFVGLVVPHLLRGVVGARHRMLVPTAAVGGAFFVLACDVLVRVLPTQSELPLGVVSGLIGAPIFLVMLVRARKEAVL
jgi:iron complex transport system permease protein